MDSIFSPHFPDSLIHITAWPVTLNQGKYLWDWHFHLEINYMSSKCPLHLRAFALCPEPHFHQCSIVLKIIRISVSHYLFFFYIEIVCLHNKLPFHQILTQKYYYIITALLHSSFTLRHQKYLIFIWLTLKIHFKSVYLHKAVGTGIVTGKGAVLFDEAMECLFELSRCLRWKLMMSHISGLILWVEKAPETAYSGLYHVLPGCTLYP